MTQPQLDKTYEPRSVEERWHRFWIEKGYFHPSVDEPGQPYSIVIPPPNVTGSLHIGHALNNTLQDILARWRRMQGRNVLWMPGMDHAGIATQNVVERQLAAEGSSREALGRDAFIRRVWTWKEQSGGTIVQQLKRLGASCDWRRMRFTMDEGLSTAVREVFVRLYEDGLIYRGERLINWCPRCLTALSDIEVEHVETKGKLYHIAYPLSDDPTVALTVATTRPETLLGDTAVAVHPDDPRYNRLIGKTVRLPLTQRDIPIVGDPILVDREFGTGAVKITPAHDFNDFDAGERHGLPRLPIFDHFARLDPIGLRAARVDEAVLEKVELLPAATARPKIEQWLHDRGALVKTEAHKMAVGTCYRCKTVVEPYLSPQWFVKIKPLAEPAIQAVQDGRIRLIPEGWVNNYLGWMRDIKDWCISRQIWWGHQVPAWYCLKCNEHAILETAHETMETTEAAGLPGASRYRVTILPQAKPIVQRAAPDRCPTCQGTSFIQDPDVLDTWFSSALWPFSTMGWPERTRELATFFPTSTLVTGLDILFFWVARMIMMGLKFTGQVPFRDVYIHALVRDQDGDKMSKSKGNVIDPLIVMDQYGTDALRFTLAALATPGRDVKLVKEKGVDGNWRAPQIEGYRNFANKIWNAARFVLMHIGPEAGGAAPPVPSRSAADRWILSRLNRLVATVNGDLEAYRFDHAALHLYQFVWHEFCDWYLELVKPCLQAGPSPARTAACATLAESLEVIMRLLHPIMPFLTEEIWHVLPHQGESLAIQRYPEPKTEWEALEVERAFDSLQRFVSTLRAGRVLLHYPPGHSITVYGTSADADEQAALQSLQSEIGHLSRASVQIVGLDRWPSGRVLRLAVGTQTVGLAVKGDVDLNQALGRVTKQLEDGRTEAKRLEGKLGSPDFVGKAPADVVTEHRERLAAIRHEEAMLQSSESQLRLMLTHPS